MNYPSFDDVWSVFPRRVDSDNFKDYSRRTWHKVPVDLRHLIWKDICDYTDKRRVVLQKHGQVAYETYNQSFVKFVQNWLKARSEQAPSAPEEQFDYSSKTATEEEDWKVLMLRPEADIDVARAVYRILISRNHPDRDGCVDVAQRINVAWDRVRLFIKNRDRC